MNTSNVSRFFYFLYLCAVSIFLLAALFGVAITIADLIVDDGCKSIYSESIFVFSYLYQIFALLISSECLSIKWKHDTIFFGFFIPLSSSIFFPVSIFVLYLHGNKISWCDFWLYKLTLLYAIGYFVISFFWWLFIMLAWHNRRKINCQHIPDLEINKNEFVVDSGNDQ
jgi:hypothetical protein